MLVDVWDVYADNCFIQRVHYYGLVESLRKTLGDKGHIVRVVKAQIDA